MADSFLLYIGRFDVLNDFVLFQLDLGTIQEGVFFHVKLNSKPFLYHSEYKLSMF